MNNMLSNQLEYRHLVEKINTKTWSAPVQKPIIDDCYKFFFKDTNQWKLNSDNTPIYVIGISEDEYDYYWLCITRDFQLKFITCCYDIDNSCKTNIHQFNDKEKKLVINKVIKYFEEHSDKENLIYLDEKLYKVE